ncbi:MAG: hypothetical protein GXO57_04115 [Thermodesulfobacteria bacterium]|nr:hypothetical protein [Thermodesulfobacteriota bacterium]
MKTWLRYSFFFFLIFFLYSCASKKVCMLPQSLEPISHQAQFVEASSPTEYLIYAKGKGCTVMQAQKDAEKAALWFVLYDMSNPLIQTPLGKDKAKVVENTVFKNPEVFIDWISQPKSKEKEEGCVVMGYLIKVNVGRLKKFLVEKGVITSTQALARKVGLPFIAVLPTSKSSYDNFAATVVQEYLQDRGYEVFVPQAQTKVEKLIKKVAMLEGNVDPFYMEALQVGSDVFIKVKTFVSKEVKYGKTFFKASVEGKAYETTTGKLLGAATGFSPERETLSPETVIQEATNDMADKILRQVRTSWLNEVKYGKPFKLVIFSTSNLFPEVEESIYEEVQKLSQMPVKVVASGKSAGTYVIYLKNTPNAFSLFYKLKKFYQGPGVMSKLLATGSLLIIKVDIPSQEVTIE